MLWETIAFAVAGLAVAYAATRLLSQSRRPATPLALVTGPVAALVGGSIARTVLGSALFPVNLGLSVAVAAALLSVLIRRPRTERHRPAPRPA
ncbi:hypothetical protein ACFWVC_05125 [Streptomyces sp. NPDC058691]|uniref:hypothetical protein n=1 Tax=Streptomyces sp. NPDC058691 TaxID=3346601 RepID=UPI0036503F5F